MLTTTPQRSKAMKENQTLARLLQGHRNLKRLRVEIQEAIDLLLYFLHVRRLDLPPNQGKDQVTVACPSGAWWVLKDPQQYGNEGGTIIIEYSISDPETSDDPKYSSSKIRTSKHLDRVDLELIHQMFHDLDALADYLISRFPDMAQERWWKIMIGASDTEE